MAPPPRRPARRPFSARGAPPGEPRGGPRPPRRVGDRWARVGGAQRPREGPTAPCERNGRPRRGTTRKRDGKRAPGEASAVPAGQRRRVSGRAGGPTAVSGHAVRTRVVQAGGKHGKPPGLVVRPRWKKRPASPCANPTALTPKDGAPRSAPKPRPPRPPPCRGGGCGDAQEVPRRSLATPFGQESLHQVSSACSRRDWPFIYVERRD